MIIEKSKKDASNSLNDLGRQVSDATILMHEAIARKAGLTGTDHKYLSVILKNGKITAGKLSELTGLTTGAVTGLIDRLEKQKLVKREFDKADRRIMIVPNLVKANKLFESSHLDLKTKVENLVLTFSEDEILVIERFLVSSIEIMTCVTNKLNGK